MEMALKESIIKYINQKDPYGELVSEINPHDDYSGGKISYNKDNLTLHRNISVLKDEEYVRAYLVVRLVKELQGQRAEIERLRDQIDKTTIQAVIEEAVRN